MSHILGSSELIEDVHKRELCIGCGACVDICPYFKNYKGKTAQLFPCTLEQGRCYAYCPKVDSKFGMCLMTEALWEISGKCWPPGPVTK